MEPKQVGNRVGQEITKLEGGKKRKARKKNIGQFNNSKSTEDGKKRKEAAEKGKEKR